MNQYEEWVIQDHELGWEPCISRLKWLDSSLPRFEHGFLFSGGAVSARIWEESRYCFIRGQFVATVLLCLALNERVLSGRLRQEGIDEAKHYSAYEAIDKAEETGLLNQKEAEKLHTLRHKRNPLTHYREPTDDDLPTNRALEQDTHYNKIFEKDAKDALLTTFRVMSKFGVGEQLSRKIGAEHHPDQSKLSEFHSNTDF